MVKSVGTQVEIHVIDPEILCTTRENIQCDSNITQSTQNSSSSIHPIQTVSRRYSFNLGTISTSSSKFSIFKKLTFIKSEKMNNKVLLIVGSFLTSFVLFAYLTHNGYLSLFLLWLGRIGYIGNLFLILFYIITSFPVPMGTTPLALSAGFLYGVSHGFLTVTIGSNLGALISFYLCKKLLADWISNKVRTNQTFMAVLSAVEKHSFKICFFVRLSPIPFGFQNSLFSMSKITLPVYLSSTFLGLFPEQLMLVYFGSTAKELKDIFEGKTNFGFVQQIMMAGQVVVCILILAFLTYTGRKAFNDAAKEDERSSIME